MRKLREMEGELRKEVGIHRDEKKKGKTHETVEGQERRGANN